MKIALQPICKFIGTLYIQKTNKQTSKELNKSCIQATKAIPKILVTDTATVDFPNNWLFDSLASKTIHLHHFVNISWIYEQLDWRSPVYSGRFEYLLKFTLLTHSWAPTPVHWCTIWGYWNFRFEFVMR